jgi:DNA-binding MarR family transcriptional regulator
MAAELQAGCDATVPVRGLAGRRGEQQVDSAGGLANAGRMDARPTYRLHDSVLYQMTLTSRLQERRLEDGLRHLGLTRVTWCVLVAVGNEGLRRPSDIAEFIGIDRTATSRALRGMEAAGWVARESGSPDRRTTNVGLTPSGCDLLRRAIPVTEENNRHFLSKLTAAEGEELARLMARLRAGEARDLPRF